MTARDDLLYEMTHNHLYMDDDQANAKIDAFAHELAEQIRNSSELRDLTDDHMSDCYAAADLIDPKFDEGIPDHLYHESCPGACCGGGEDL